MEVIPIVPYPHLADILSGLWHPPVPTSSLYVTTFWTYRWLKNHHITAEMFRQFLVVLGLVTLHHRNVLNTFNLVYLSL